MANLKKSQEMDRAVRKSLSGSKWGNRVQVYYDMGTVEFMFLLAVLL